MAVSGAEDMSADALLSRFATMVAEKLCELQGTPKGDPVTKADWVDQKESILGARLHCAAVRRRLAEGKGGADIRPDRRHLLTREALLEEMARSPKPGLRKAVSRTPAPTGKDAAVEATLAKLRLIRGSRPKKG